MNIKNNFIESIGNTPLIKLNYPSKITGCNIYGKAEFLNPGGSIKDRAAKAIILDAIKQGKLKNGGSLTIDYRDKEVKLDCVEENEIAETA